MSDFVDAFSDALTLENITLKFPTEYRIWASMLQRCNNPRNSRYARYGGRGITVDISWVGRGGFRRFLAYVGPRPTQKSTLDRGDNNSGYRPGNLRWASHYEQCRNMEKNHWLEFEGERLIFADWARRAGISEATLKRRLRDGWSLQEALTIPKGDSGVYPLYVLATAVKNAMSHEETPREVTNSLREALHRAASLVHHPAVLLQGILL